MMADGETHPGVEALLVTGGRLNVYLPDTYDWIELNPKGSFFIPEGVTHRYCNHTHEVIDFFFSVAPRYP